MKQQEVREKLATACRIIATAGHEDFIWGHMSARDGESSDRFWMKGHSMGLLEVGPEHMLLLNLEGNILEGRLPRHSEYPIHSEIYRLRPEIGAVIHTHPFYATILASLDLTLDLAIGWGSLTGNDAIPRYDKQKALIDTPELGREVAEAMGSSKLLFLRNHGIVLAAENVEMATFMAIRLEKISQAQLIAAAAGVPAFPTDEEENLARIWALNRQEKWVWAYLQRQALPHGE